MEIPPNALACWDFGIWDAALRIKMDDDALMMYEFVQTYKVQAHPVGGSDNARLELFVKKVQK